MASFKADIEKLNKNCLGQCGIMCDGQRGPKDPFPCSLSLSLTCHNCHLLPTGPECEQNHQQSGNLKIVSLCCTIAGSLYYGNPLCLLSVNV